MKNLNSCGISIAASSFNALILQIYKHQMVLNEFLLTSTITGTATLSSGYLTKMPKTSSCHISFWKFPTNYSKPSSSYLYYSIAIKRSNYTHNTKSYLWERLFYLWISFDKVKDAFFLRCWEKGCFDFEEYSICIPDFEQHFH